MADAAVALRQRVDVGHDRDARICDAQRAQLRRQPLFGRLHQRAMERRADRQRHDALGAQRLCARSPARSTAALRCRR